MFAGHIALALAAKRVRPEAPLLLLLVAAQGPDWVEVLLADLARRPDAPLLSHSAASVLAGAALLLGVGWVRLRSPAAGALLFALYASHLPLDLVTGEKRLWSGLPPVGLGLYDRPLLDFALEAAIVLAGWLLYRGSLPPRARRSGRALLLLLLLLASQAAVDAAFAWL